MSDFFTGRIGYNHSPLIYVIKTILYVCGMIYALLSLRFVIHKIRYKGKRMKKLISVVAAAMVIGTVSSASALMFTEEYTGKQHVKEGKSFSFGFDMWLENDDSASFGKKNATNSSLKLTQDAYGADAYDSWDSAKLTVDLYAKDKKWEKANFKFVAFNDLFPDTIFNLGKFKFNGKKGDEFAQFTHTFTDSQLDAFDDWGWGKVKIKAINTNKVKNNFNVTRVAMDVNVAPVPEPSTMLLFGAGIAGLVGYSRRRSSK